MTTPKRCEVCGKEKCLNMNNYDEAKCHADHALVPPDGHSSPPPRPDENEKQDEWTKQTVVGENGNCHSAVIASLLKIPIEEAWHFSQVPEGASWVQHLSQWAAARGLTYLMWRADSGILPHGLHEIHGDGGRGWGHVVLGKDGKAVFDPHPDNTFLKTTEWYGKFIPCGLMLNYAIRSDDSLLLSYGKEREKEMWRKCREAVEKSNDEWVIKNGASVRRDALSALDSVNPER